MANPYPATFIDQNAEGRLVGELDFTDPGNQPGGGSAFVSVFLRHSAAFTNLNGNAPVVVPHVLVNTSAVLTLPPSAVGNNSIIDVQVVNVLAADVDVGGSLVVQSADGTVWIAQDTSVNQTVAAGTAASIDFDTNGGSAGAGLSWNAGTKQVDIASAGVFSAFVTLYALPA